MADNGEKLDKTTILNTTARQIVFDHVMQGFNLKEAAKEANLGHNYVKKWVSTSNFYPLINQERAKIAEKIGITVSNQQLELIKDRETARKKGKTASAIRCTELLLKTIGGFQSDAPNPKALLAKEDTEKVKALKRAFAEWYYNRKYLASKPGLNSEEITEVDWTQNDDTVSGSEENQDDQENQASFLSEKQG